MVKRPSAPSAFDTAPLMEVTVKKSTGKQLLKFPVPDTSNFKVMRKYTAMAKIATLDLETRMKPFVSAMMVGLGIAQCKRPDNFIGVEGSDECTVIFSQRSGALEVDELALLAEHNVPLHVENIPETFYINPDYLKDPKMRAKLEAAFDTIKDRPDNIMLKTPASTKTSIDGKTIDAIFATPDPRDETKLIPRDPAIVAKLLPVVMTLGFKPVKDEATDILSVFAKAEEIMKRSTLKDKMLEAANDPDKVLSNEYGKPKKKKAA